MKINGYSDLLKKQFEILYGDNVKSDLSEKIFYDVCKKLERDFLPPIEREDIASISLILYEISRLAVNLTTRNKIKSIFKESVNVTDELLYKKKTCGESIRRLIKIYSDFRPETKTEEKINDLISDLIKRLNEAYFKSL